MENLKRDIAGTYRAWNPGIRSAKAWRWFAGLWGLVAALFLAQAVLAFSEGRSWAAAVYVLTSICFALTASLGSFTRTVISPEGVRVNRWFRWRELPWDQVASVRHNRRWSRFGTLTVITRAGDSVDVDFPDLWQADFVAYAQAHGAPAAASGGDAG